MLFLNLIYHCYLMKKMKKKDVLFSLIIISVWNKERSKGGREKEVGGRGKEVGGRGGGSKYTTKRQNHGSLK